MKYVIVMAALLLSACVSDEEFARRGATYAPNYPYDIVRVEDPHSYCKSIGARVKIGGVARDGNSVRIADLNITHESHINGCADWGGKLVAGRCTIFVGNDAPEWLIQHEKFHCKYGDFHS